MKRRKPTERERFDNLSLSYSSKAELARSISRATGQSPSTVARHFREGGVTRSEIAALQRREKYQYRERPKERARQYIESLERGERGVIKDRLKYARYDEDNERWGRGVIDAADIIGRAGASGVYMYDFINDMVSGNIPEIDLEEMEGRKLRFVAEVIDSKTGEKKQYLHDTMINNELPSVMYEIFRSHYNDGSGDSISIVGPGMFVSDEDMDWY